MTVLRSPRVPIGTKYLIGEMLVPVRKANLQARDVSQKVVGSNPGAGKLFIVMKSLLKCTCKLISLWNWKI